MKGIVLGYSLHDYKSELREGDLVLADEQYYELYKIDGRYLRFVGDPDNPNKYFVRSHRNKKLMNYSRDEISKAECAIFDSDKYFNDGKMILLGRITPSILKHLRQKYAYTHDVDFKRLETIELTDLLEIEFDYEHANTLTV